MAKKRMTKSEFVGAIAKKSGMEKKQINATLTALNEVVYKELSKGAGEVVLPGLIKLVTVKKAAVPEKEIAGIFNLQHELFVHNMPNARVHYDHLSTDIASLYWEKYIDNPKDFDTLLSSARRIRVQETYSFPVNNFFIYIPETLSEDDVFKCELLIEILKMLGNNFHEMFHIMIHCLGDLLVGLIEEIIIEEYSNRPGNVFATIDKYDLLNLLKIHIMKKEPFLSRIPFIEDLTNFSIKKVMCQRKPQPYEAFTRQNVQN